MCCPVVVPVVLRSLPLFRNAESHHSLWRHYLCNNYILFMTFDYLSTLLTVCVKQLILSHAYD
jgi:hypothetical protein